MDRRRRIVVTRAAVADLIRLEAFLTNKSTRSAGKAVERIQRGVGQLAETPEIGKMIASDLRELVLWFGKNAYVVRYRVTEDEVLITRIWHSKEDRSA